MQASNLLAQAGHAFFALTHSAMNMHGRAAAMVTPIGDKKTLLPAESAVNSSGWTRSAQERQLAKEEMEAREPAGSAATRRCVRRPRLQRARVRLCGFLEGVSS